MLVIQKNSVDCGPTCLQMVAKYYGHSYSAHRVRTVTQIDCNGVNLSYLEKGAQQLGFQTWVVELDIANLNQIPLPAILHWNNDHYVVLTKVDKFYHILDPAMGAIKLDQKTFASCWIADSKENNEGIALVLTPSTSGLSAPCTPSQDVTPWSLIVSFIAKRKRHAIFLAGIIAAGMILGMFLPWTWKLFYDDGIDKKDISFLLGLICFQLFIAVSVLHVEYRQGVAIAQASNSISRSLTHSFFRKLLKIPVHLFEHRSSGDLLQRIGDIERIEELLGVQFLTAVISSLSSVLFLSFLFYYQWEYAVIFIVLTGLSFLWFYSLYSSRKLVDYQLFYEQTRYQDEVLDILNGLPEIKSYGYEKKKLSYWNVKYARAYKLKRRLIAIGLKQRYGYRLCHLIKDAIIFYLAGVAVINGQLSTGLLLSVSYILQQINNPLDELIALFDSLQDSVTSMERLKDVMLEPEVSTAPALPEGDLVLDAISFTFPGSPLSLKNISLKFESHKITALIGKSGCGKTTLLNIIFGFKPVQSGQIHLGPSAVTQAVSVLMPSVSAFVKQDGYLFADSIKENIIMDGVWDEAWFLDVLDLCQLEEWIFSLPGEENTRVGRGGMPISGGQKQRILLARALYRRPHFLLLDEATSALDIETEYQIGKNIQYYSRQYHCTVIMITHRPDIMKMADNIVVMEDGRIAAQGTPAELSSPQSDYAELFSSPSPE